MREERRSSTHQRVMQRPALRVATAQREIPMPTMANVPEKCAERHEGLCPPSSAPSQRVHRAMERRDAGAGGRSRDRGRHEATAIKDVDVEPLALIHCEPQV